MILRSAAATLLAASLQLAPLARTDGAAIPILGRWDVTVATSSGPRPAWFDFEQDTDGLHATVMVVAGMPFTIRHVDWGGNRLEMIADGVGRFTGTWDGEYLTGIVVAPDSASRSSWRAQRAPALPWRAVTFAAPETLFDGRSLAGWKSRGGRHGWVVREGALCNDQSLADLVSLQQYRDFKLHIEFRTEPGEDSGIHLRGRYEIQVLDEADPRVGRAELSIPGRLPEDLRVARLGTTGAIYGFLPPRSNPQRPAGEWNSLDVTLVGRTLSATLNGAVIHDRETIPGITGDALDSDEAMPGPIMLQGYIGRVSYRNIVVTPAR